MDVVDGNIDRFGILYERYKIPVYGYFFKLTSGDRQASEDLSHNVFLKALKYKHSFRGTGSFAKWLFSIAHNVGMDYLRKLKYKSANEINPDVNSESNDGYEQMESKERNVILRTAMEMLSPQDREILVLAKMLEMKYSEIADIKGCSENAIKTRICRALRKLKDIYLEFEQYNYERQGKN